MKLTEKVELFKYLGRIVAQYDNEDDDYDDDDSSVKVSLQIKRRSNS